MPAKPRAKSDQAEFIASYTHALLRQVVDAIPEYALVIDRNYHVLFANRFVRLANGEDPVAAHMTCHQLQHGVDLPCADLGSICPVDQAIRNKKPCTITHNHHAADGGSASVRVTATPILDDHGQVICILETARVLSGSEQTKEELRRERDFAESLIETAEVIVLVLDTEGRILRLNNYLARISGYTLDEVRGKDWFDTFLPQRDRASIRRVFHEVVRNATHHGKINPIVTKDGRERMIEWNGKTLKDNSGAVIGLLSIGQDVTDKIRIEREKDELETKLQQAQKMEAVGELAGGIAHDFNNILTAILGNVELMQAELLEELPPEDSLVTSLGQIERAAQRATSLTRRLLSFSRQQIYKTQSLALNDVFGEFEEMLRSLLTPRIQFKSALAPDLAPIQADKIQIEQILLNLVLNARDAMPMGGKLTISTRNTSLDTTFLQPYPGTQPGDYVQISVADTGRGMDESVQKRIFEPFFTTKPQGRGTGLGLPTILGIVRQARGLITVESEPDHGSTFHVYFPAASPAAENVEATTENEPSDVGTETVLICEDEDNLRSLACKFLERGGYKVISSPSGPEALKLAAAFRDPIHLLITDMVMPEMNGRELAEAIRAERPDTRVLYVSGYAAGTMGDRRVLPPDARFLEKPYTPRTLLARVREVLDESERQNIP